LMVFTPPSPSLPSHSQLVLIPQTAPVLHSCHSFLELDSEHEREHEIFVSLSLAYFA
jgi:hypothetical protein